MKNCYIIRYAELGLKGLNRSFFERKLIENIKASCQKNNITIKDIMRPRGRIIVYTDTKTDIFRLLPGISSYSLASEVEYSAVLKKCDDFISGLSDKDTFRVSCQRIDKEFFKNSAEIERELGEYIFKNSKNKVSLTKFTKEFSLEIINGKCYVYSEKVSGVGGLPVGVSGKVICLLSGGLDSPVAAYMMMKRGCEVVFIHFYNQFFNKEDKDNKIIELARELGKHQSKTKLYLVSFVNVQKEIIKNVQPDLRVLFFRRFMFEYAEKLLDQEKAKAIVSGDNLGQVASQTLENLFFCGYLKKSLIIRPLICFDKIETIELSKKIGTYDIAIKEYNDCCSLLVAKHPKTKADVKDIELYEHLIKFDFDKIEKEVILL